MEIKDNLANKICQNSMIVDAHYDLLFDVTKQRENGRKKVIETDHLPNFIQGGVNLVVSSIYIDSIFLPEMALRRALNQVSALYAEIDESTDKIMLCRNLEDFQKAQKEGKVGIMLSFEGVEPLYNDLSLLRVFYELGVRVVGLVWSRRNYAADGCQFGNSQNNQKGGITEFGAQLVKEAESLGMIIDVSHLNDEGFWDVMNITEKPVIASHSNCRSIASTMRNLTDKQIKAIASKDGVIGINAANILVADHDENADLEYMINHIDHIVNLVGIKHVGFGFDFCNMLYRNLSIENLVNIPRKPFDVVNGHQSICKVIASLIRKGYTEEEIDLIAGNNYLRVYREIK